MRKHWIWGGCAALLAVGSLACGEEPPPAEAVARPIKILEVGGVDSGRVLELPGEIQASQRADLGFEVPGLIISLPVVEGQPVKEGEEIGRLDARDYQAQLNAANAKLRQTKADYERRRILYEKDVISQAEMELRKRTYEVAQTEVATATKAVEDTVLRAPFEGVIARKLKQERENVQAKEAVVRFQNDALLEIVVAVPERAMVQGQTRDTSKEEITRRVQPKVEISSLPGRRFPAEVTEFALVADPVTRTFPVTVAFEGPTDANVLPGMTARVIVLRQDVDGYMLPATAVVGGIDKEPFVWIVDPETMAVSAQEVVLGNLSGDQVEVTAGIEDGQLVALSGVRKLRPGMVVRRLGE
jgi:RND family efflux transporter MFP subunit